MARDMSVHDSLQRKKNPPILSFSWYACVFGETYAFVRAIVDVRRAGCAKFVWRLSLHSEWALTHRSELD